MKKSTLKNLIALTALAVMACFTGKIQAQNNWTNIGASPGGGYIIIGHSAPTDLGALGPSTTPVFTSAHGSDLIILDGGNTATSAGAYTIDLEAPGNTLNNYGTINNTNGVTGYGVFAASSGNTINNLGTIEGEYAVALGGNSNVVNNWSMVTSGYTGAYIYGQNNVFNNQGTVSAGDYAVLLYGTGNTVNNWGTMTTPYDTVYEDGTSNTINNHGNITSTGSYGVYSDGLAFTLNNWGAITVAQPGQQAIFTDGNNFTFNNWGTVTSASDGVWLESNNSVINNWGMVSAARVGINVQNDYNTINNNGGVISGNEIGIFIKSGADTINNQGLVNGNSLAGIELEGSYNVVNNWGQITSSQDAGIGDSTELNTLNNWGYIYGEQYGINFGASDIVVNNWGLILSGDDAILLNAPDNLINNWGTLNGKLDALYINDSNNLINNWGTFTSPSTNQQGAVYFSPSAQGNVLNNWGMITSNSGPVAIGIDGANNTLNLNGHSSVIGKIAVTGAGNVVNLNFTGVQATLLPALNASLVAQGANSGLPTSVQFTLRQVNYNIDPAMVNLNMSSYQMQGLNLSEKSVGAALDSLTFNPAPGTPLFNLLNAIDASGNVPAALQALSPENYAIYGDLAIANSTAIVQNIDARLNNLRDGSESVDTTGVGGTSDQTTAGFSKNDGKESKQIVAPPVERRWGFFATGDGLFYRGAGAAGGGKSNNAGTLLGVDGKINENGVIGAFFSYDNADAKFGGSGASQATIESYTGGIYGSYHNDGFFANSLAAYTRNNYASARSLAFPGFINSLGGSTDGNQYTFNLDGGYDWHLNDRVTMGPIAGLQYVHLDVDGFNETGGAGALAIGSQSMDSLQSRLGGRLNYHIHTGATSSFAAELHAAWQHEYLDGSRSIGGAFGGGISLPFSVQTGSPKRDAGVVGVGVNWTFHDRLTLFADYELTMWSSSTFEQTINGGARISF